MKKICIFLLLVTALTSCVKDVILDAMEDPLLAVYCVLTQDSTQTLKLSWTKGPSEAEAPRIAEATALLTDLTVNQEAGRFIRISENDWQLEYAAIPTHSYRLEVTVPGHAPVWAEQTMPDEVPLFTHSGNELVRDKAYPWLNLDAEHYTSFISWVEGVSVVEVAAHGMFYGFSSPCAVWITAHYLDAESGLYIPVKELCTDNPYVDNSNLTGEFLAPVGPPEHFNSPDLVSGVYRENYLMGYPYHRDYLRFPKRDDQTNNCYAIDGDFKGRENTLENIIIFAAMSDDYDRYLCEAYMQSSAEQSSDISSIYLRDNIYTNIKGGLGIFGAATSTYFYWIRPTVGVKVFGPKYDDFLRK